MINNALVSLATTGVQVAVALFTARAVSDGLTDAIGIMAFAIVETVLLEALGLFRPTWS